MHASLHTGILHAVDDDDIILEEATGPFQAGPGHRFSGIVGEGWGGFSGLLTPLDATKPYTLNLNAHLAIIE